MSKTKKISYTRRALILRELFDNETHIKMQEHLRALAPFVHSFVDDDSFNRYYLHNPSFFVNIHHQLTDFASDIFGERVKPSYCFLSMYKNGGKCALHIDRPQCRYTIDYLISKSTEDVWEICVSEEMEDSEIKNIKNPVPSTQKDIEAVINKHSWDTIDLHPNDAVLYSGTHSWHYRPEKLEGTADLIFFHFVPESFNDTLE